MDKRKNNSISKDSKEVANPFPLINSGQNNNELKSLLLP